MSLHIDFIINLHLQGADSTTSLALSLDTDTKINKDGEIRDSSIQISVPSFEEGAGNER